jgi:hypothetical protein
MSTTKNGVTPKLTRGKEEDIAKGEISKTPLSNWGRRLEILDNRHNIITKEDQEVREVMAMENKSATRNGVKNSQATRKSIQPRLKIDKV